ncbi:DUF1214 domain-containing protein [Robertkochia solimangrovi]|uniref:DUF1214 domain-containing protein n=1 Tax=Robertkochia solimangrovi TaxID=2213046 RepID=UPI00117FA545|nr:DUF1214 domain-containing protein [Robertkochia solimangrovi]TRZ44001.1 hypothetical protein DMZ48_08460 [Robertkochia solimangrovi]
MKNPLLVLFVFSFVLLLNSCKEQRSDTAQTAVDDNGYAILTDDEVSNLVRRSYQYVAMYNVNNKFALADKGMSTKGYNKGLKNTQLLDHTVKAIARPNNDVMYQMAMLDLRKDAVIFEFPAMDSKYVSLMATGYDHYVNVPLSTTEGDFKEPITLLFYSARTENYKGAPVEGVDEVLEMTGDFISLVLRVMPHANEPEKYKRIIDQINAIKGMSLSEYQNKPKLQDDPIDFPDYGDTDADTYKNNLLEVMQFIFNHTTFDTTNVLDNTILKAFQPLGIIPGKVYNPQDAIRIDGDRFAKKSLEIKNEYLAKMNDPEISKVLLPRLFQLKDKMEMEPMLLQSVIGPIGLPLKEAVYPPVVTADGSSMNAMHDYIIEMSKEEIPPSNAFWSMTLYDTENGFFIPNDHKKYSVGENSGMKLNADGGIRISISESKPADIPEENWLPINRIDQNMDVILRVYAPDLERMKTWSPPKAIKVEE